MAYLRVKGACFEVPERIRGQEALAAWSPRPMLPLVLKDVVAFMMF